MAYIVMTKTTNEPAIQSTNTSHDPAILCAIHRIDPAMIYIAHKLPTDLKHCMTSACATCATRSYRLAPWHLTGYRLAPDWLPTGTMAPDWLPTGTMAPDWLPTGAMAPDRLLKLCCIHWHPSRNKKARRNRRRRSHGRGLGQLVGRNQKESTVELCFSHH